MKNWMLALLVALALSACASCMFEPTPTGRSACDSGPPPKPRLPYRAWSLAIAQPLYMETWVETANVEDIRGLRFIGAYHGLSSGISPTAGWGDGASVGRTVDGADLPRRIFLRWQSLVEPQTYRITLDIPESARKLMLRQERSAVTPKELDYRNILLVGIAPGGKVALWNKGPGLERIEILRAQAEVEPLGPYSGQSGGKYRPLSERAKQYIQQNGIPYGSW